MYIYICIYRHINTCSIKHIDFIHILVHVNNYVYVYVCVCVCVCVYVCMCTGLDLRNEK